MSDIDALEVAFSRLGDVTWASRVDRTDTSYTHEMTVEEVDFALQLGFDATGTLIGLHLRIDPDDETALEARLIDPAFKVARAWPPAHRVEIDGRLGEAQKRILRNIRRRGSCMLVDASQVNSAKRLAKRSGGRLIVVGKEIKINH